MGRRRTRSTWQAVNEAELDRISCLPGNVMDQILSHLTIKEAVRTSILSSKWKNKWYTLPNLVFDDDCVSVSVAASQDPLVIESKFIKVVDHVLLLHSGPVNMFKLSDSENDIYSLNAAIDIDRWILCLIGRSIKELALHVFLYKIPWCLFSCQSLHHLELKWCLLNPPTTFEGFRNLRSLGLKLVTLTQDAFENLISGCTLLESLTVDIYDLTQINIHAQNLKFFRLSGKFEDISLDNTLQLTVVSIYLGLYLNSESNQSRLHGCSSNLLKFFDHRPHIQSLEIGNYFLKYLAVGVVPVKLPTPCINLGYLSLCINFNDLKEILATLCLLRSSPNLRTLAIHARIEEQTVLSAPESYSWEDIFSRPGMSVRVLHVTIHGISGTKQELDFIRFLLLYLPVLETMHVKTVANVTSELTKELIRFKRASGEAEVIWEDFS